MAEKLPEPEGWLAKAAIDCLKQWQADWGPVPFYLHREDIDHLERWLENLRLAWISTANALHRDGIPVEQYPVKVKDEAPRPVAESPAVTVPAKEE